MRHAMVICTHTNSDILQMFINLYDDERYDFSIKTCEETDTSFSMLVPFDT